MRASRLALLFVLGEITMASTNVLSQTVPSNPTAAVSEAAHVVNSFRFEIAAAMKDVAPMFGPEAERRWAGEEWNPVFLYPRPGRDVQGAVFTVDHGPIHTVWVNTVFDLSHGRMQYVAISGDHFVTTVEVQLTAVAASRTSVQVTYARTALVTAANDHVRELGERDRTSGPEWQRGIETALGLTK